MANVVLIVHLIVAVALIAVVLLQRSEGGALGIGGGGGGLMSGRSAATALTKLTWALGAAFVATSMMLTVLAARNARDATVIEGGTAPRTGGVEIIVPDLGDEPATPPASETSAPEPATSEEPAIPAEPSPEEEPASDP